MFRQTWQSLKSTFQEGKASQPPLAGETGTSTLPPLTDADFEFLWMQLLEGVVHGWESHRIEKFFQQLDERADKAKWLDWLGRYRDKVTTTAVPDQVLAKRLLLVQQQMRSLRKFREIGTTAGLIGRQILSTKQTPPLNQTPVWEYEGPDAPSLSAQAPKAETPTNLQVQTISAEELAERLETDQVFRQFLAQQLGVAQDSDPQTLLQALVAKSHMNQEPDHPTDASGWFERGLKAAQAGQWEAALHCWDRVLEFEPQSQQAWYNRGGTLMMLQKHEDAITSYDHSLERRPNDFEAWFHRGICLSQLERYEEAIKSYDQAIILKQDYWHAWVHRGLAVEAAPPTDSPGISPLAEQTPSLQQQGYEGAIATYTKAFEYIDPEAHPEGWGRLHWVSGVAHAHQALKNDEESHWRQAIEHYHQALETLTHAAFPQAHLEILKNLIYAHQRLGETETASQLQQQGAELAQKLQG